MQVSIVKLHARLTATRALNGLAATVWDRASKARIGITSASQKAAGVVVLCTNGSSCGDTCHPISMLQLPTAGTAVTMETTAPHMEGWRPSRILTARVPAIWCSCAATSSLQQLQ